VPQTNAVLVRLAIGHTRSFKNLGKRGALEPVLGNSPWSFASAASATSVPGRVLFASNGGRRVKPLRVNATVMILPQVHLRKPCYDFYFL
jgi:hypothetical protein